MAFAGERVDAQPGGIRPRDDEARARARLYAAPRRALAVPLLSVVCAAVLGVGWWTRDELYLSPEHGLGYALGIVGLSIAALQLLYTLRKHLRPLRRLGRLKPWFQVHMLLGVVAPVAILFHSNFHLGSLNSTVALASLLIVVASGYIGRFIYTKIHLGLHGRRQELREVKGDAEDSRSALGSLLRRAPLVAKRILEFEAFAIPSKSGFLGTLLRFFLLGTRARTTRRTCLRLLRNLPADPGAPGPREVTFALRAHLAAVKRVAQFTAYERLFALWHTVHIPLCFLLFTAATVHVIAVHMY